MPSCLGGARIYYIELWSHWLSDTCVRQGLSFSVSQPHRSLHKLADRMWVRWVSKVCLVILTALVVTTCHYRMAYPKATFPTEKLPAAEWTQHEGFDLNSFSGAPSQWFCIFLRRPDLGVPIWNSQVQLAAEELKSKEPAQAQNDSEWLELKLKR